MTKLKQLIQVITRAHIYIQTHNYPDQDALATAYGLQFLLESQDINSTICYSGQIDKYNTLNMVELLKISPLNMEEVTFTKEDEVILVDSQQGNVNVKSFEGRKIACIDHHPKQDTKGYLFYDIRSEIGACSTIIGEYFMENKLKPSKEVATALLYGIKLDTDNLTKRVSVHDVEMFAYLFKNADLKILKKLESSSLRKADLNAYQEAMRNLRIYGRVGIARIGDDCSEAIIGSISDFLLSLSEVDVTLVYSYRVGGLKFSIRSEAGIIDAGKIIKEALTDLGDGGGHATMAAGFIPNLNTSQEINQAASLVEQRVLSIINKVRKDIFLMDEL
ncbi:hypothetical protein acsn021_43490 [Anaerocolumna cellulosilytica]|uniref:Uncharacterized protein n=1 Tax=Anaerocolumna cellulosilytica TaxID=433286 RepID=A0A6S6RBA9_9FIRM|nr:DHHA1 domain-containing protein [Anaerocolumna cellulosilytica]MBB5195307.1 nanoRNase/pAp phosphatase (c-di-AMP/oligoRNAs hydrolase) [Anaerocolumna cellulosilytica]BCJ96780.1 hypothetical protein acsn021_43490 [Anaerocolumna cellulosilytica]